MRYRIENEYICAEVESLGAELKSLVTKEDGNEMMWEADPAHWAGTSPFLFPFTGKCREWQYRHQGKTYDMTQHGFAKRMDFAAACEDKDRLVLFITDTPETFSNYPFHFRLEVEHRLEGRELVVEWRVHNLGDEAMYFAIGGHPGFACPPKSDGNATKRTDCSIRLVGAENRASVENLCVGNDGMVSGEKISLSLENGILPVTEDIFDQDALLIPRQDISAVAFLDSQGREFVRVESETPIWGIWSMPDNAASYICVEPWFGLCDQSDYAGELKNRPLENHVAAGETWANGYRIIVKKSL